jgi:hypothetical protein
VNNSTFKRKAYVRTPISVPVPVRQVAATMFAGMVLVQAKECVVASEPYRRLVALFPCKICGIDGYSQAAHPNTDKGAGIKTDDRLCFPLCCDRPGVQGCHPKFDQHALYPKHVRRLLEPAWAADTQRQIIAMGAWPKGLPFYDC